MRAPGRRSRRPRTCSSGACRPSAPPPAALALPAGRARPAATSNAAPSRRERSPRTGPCTLAHRTILDLTDAEKQKQRSASDGAGVAGAGPRRAEGRDDAAGRLPRARSSRAESASGSTRETDSPTLLATQTVPSSRPRPRSARADRERVEDVSPPESMRQSLALELPVNQTASAPTAIAVVCELSTSSTKRAAELDRRSRDRASSPRRCRRARPRRRRRRSTTDAPRPSASELRRRAGPRVDARDLAPPSLQRPDGALADGEGDWLAQDRERPRLSPARTMRSRRSLSSGPISSTASACPWLTATQTDPAPTASADRDPVSGNASRRRDDLPRVGIDPRQRARLRHRAPRRGPRRRRSATTSNPSGMSATSLPVDRVDDADRHRPDPREPVRVLGGAARRRRTATSTMPLPAATSAAASLRRSRRRARALGTRDASKRTAREAERVRGPRRRARRSSRSGLPVPSPARAPSPDRSRSRAPGASQRARAAARSRAPTASRPRTHVRRGACPARHS